jgi:hypothetical protein
VNASGLADLAAVLTTNAVDENLYVLANAPALIENPTAKLRARFFERSEYVSNCCPCDGVAPGSRELGKRCSENNLGHSRIVRL